MTCDDAIKEIAAELQQFDDWEDRYGHIIAMGKKLEPFPTEHKKEDFLVSGCQSQVWLHPEYDGSTIHFDADSDALVVKGLVAILMRIYNNRTPQEILEVPKDFISTLGLDTHLSQNRANGLASMIKQIGMYAIAYSMKGAASN